MQDNRMLLVVVALSMQLEATIENELDEHMARIGHSYSDYWDRPELVVCHGKQENHDGAVGCHSRGIRTTGEHFG